jgi:hypothetical protein
MTVAYLAVVEVPEMEGTTQIKMLLIDAPAVNGCQGSYIATMSSDISATNSKNNFPLRLNPRVWDSEKRYKGRKQAIMIVFETRKPPYFPRRQRCAPCTPPPETYWVQLALGTQSVFRGKELFSIPQAALVWTRSRSRNHLDPRQQSGVKHRLGFHHLLRLVACDTQNSTRVPRGGSHLAMSVPSW